MARHESANPHASDEHNRRSQLYHDMPSVTPRAWGPMPPDDDSFGPRSLGGYGDFRTPADSYSPRGQDARTGRPRGGQRGRGPRNEVRPDASIADDIYQRLTDDEELDAGEILLSVEDGFVTLTGEVPEKAMKRRAEDVAALARGVRDIRNCIRCDDGSASFGPAGRAVRSGNDQLGSGFSSSERTQEQWVQPSIRQGRVGHENLEPEQHAADRKR
ncbi:BON domain-containing protein [Lysobacter sp. Root494]|uniref:BON domain-containing protein n=1 Tax=Lysobacter sp. Root494 TaxID=1736549 RepID=UPI0006F7B302|nr:BON domain-containing protein [Lysobacter sp. Root494]KQY51281.1 hypothetical protein ASD14_10865 [Lysobacter sp. Root494]